MAEAEIIDRSGCGDESYSHHCASLSSPRSENKGDGSSGSGSIMAELEPWALTPRRSARLRNRATLYTGEPVEAIPDATPRRSKGRISYPTPSSREHRREERVASISPSARCKDRRHGQREDRFDPEGEIRKLLVGSYEVTRRRLVRKDRLQSEPLVVGLEDIPKWVSGAHAIGDATPREESPPTPRYQPRCALAHKPLRPAGSVSLDSELTGILQAVQRNYVRPPAAERRRKTSPIKVLDAHKLQDDFYLNLVDWSSRNLIAVGLSSVVWLWSGISGRMLPLCNFGQEQVTSVSWKETGDLLAIGTRSGVVQIWDAITQQRIRTLTGHSQRVGNLAWNHELLTTGSRDRRILHRDCRANAQSVATLTAHRQEICGLKWDVVNNKLASGGNDNRLLVWEYVSASPIHTFIEHTAAVKAIAWSPHQRGVLASGGGTADKTIKLWDANLGQQLLTCDTGSQVCNLAWSKNENQLLSTHGYSQNHIAVWKPETMEQITTLTGHCSRVLYLAMSPDGDTIVTGAGDQTLMFWRPFNETSVEDDSDSTISNASDCD